MTESKRQQKFARLIQKDLSEIFQQDAQHWFNGAFITITQVRVSPDLALARVYLSFLNPTDKDGLLADIQENTKNLRQVLGQRIRHSVRIVPELQFFLDDTADYVAKMDALFAGLHIPPAE